MLGVLVCSVVEGEVCFGEGKKLNENWLLSLWEDSVRIWVWYEDSKWGKVDLGEEWWVEGEVCG